MRRHEPVTSECSQARDSAISDHLLNSDACRTDYSLEFLLASNQAQVIVHGVPVDITEGRIAFFCPVQESEGSSGCNQQSRYCSKADIVLEVTLTRKSPGKNVT